MFILNRIKETYLYECSKIAVITVGSSPYKNLMPVLASHNFPW